MEVDDQKEQGSEEDNIPSDFFDDFNKDEFIQGLSVIDSWDDDEPLAKKTQARKRISAKAVDTVNDLRELIDGKEVPRESKKEDTKMESSQWSRDDRQRSRSASRLDSYIQPGSRRDPTKTSEAIKRDKEVKVKEHLAKQLESSDDLRPPGTELDDFFEARKSTEMKKKKSFAEAVEKEKPFKSTREWNWFNSPRRSPRRKPHLERRSPRQSPAWRSPVRRSPVRRSPRRRSPHGRSPHRRSPQWRQSPRRRYSPSKRSHKSYRYSPSIRDRDRHYSSRRSRSRSLGRNSDDFLYPKEFSKPNYDSIMISDPYGSQQQPSYTASGMSDYPVSSSDFSYTQSQVYSGYSGNYDYATQPASSSMAPIPQPVPAPTVDPNLNLNPAPSMVPPPQLNSQALQPSGQSLQVAVSRSSSIDPLAKLVAEGKLSHEDYLKLAPNKGTYVRGSANSGDFQAKIAVLKRCNEAISQLDKLALPTRLLINNSVIGAEQSRLAPKYCSPLKRQVTVEFHFTKTSSTAMTQQNKQIIDNIIASIGLEKILDHSKKKPQKNMKDAAVQTTKPFCDVCEIRSATKYARVSTSTEPEYFTSTVHTQVVEQDLISSKYVFNPTGGAANNPTMSIAHLTPAQLVSQLAARAKTLKQPQDPGQQYNRNNSPGFDARGQQGRQYHENYSNFRY